MLELKCLGFDMDTMQFMDPPDFESSMALLLHPSYVTKSLIC
jgi:hypothetical protein